MAAVEEAPPSPSRVERRTSNGSSTAPAATNEPFSRKKRFELADLLRDCAALVEQNEMEQATFQKMFRELTEYVSTHGGGKVSTDSGSVDSAAAAVPPPPPVDTATTAPPEKQPVESTTTPTDPPGVPAHVKHTGTSARSRVNVTTTTTHHIPPPSVPHPASRSQPHHPPPPSSVSSRSSADNGIESTLSKEQKVNFMHTIKKNVKVMGEEFSHVAHVARTEAAKKATSAKNALRVKNELGHGVENSHSDEWCEEHFTMGCACKQHQHQQQQQKRSSANHTSKAAHNPTATAEKPRPANPSRPPFQRPVNPNSTLIANGWMEQQRRSKMRFVWKEVLVSLVAGRKKGEETTLWVQRETTNPATGQTGLEALHQIPIKGMQDVNYVDFSTDHRFVIQVYNLNDEFVFRTRDGNGDAAKNWVSTLRLTREAVMNGVPPPKAGDLQGASKRTKHYPGYSEDEKKAESPPQQQHQPPPQQQQHQPPPPQMQQPPPQQKRLSVKELRAIAHGAGVKTAGMERGELEATVAKIQQQQNGGRTTPHPPPGGRTSPHPPPGPPPPTQRTASAPAATTEDSTNPFDEDVSERGSKRLSQEEQQKREAERRARQMKLDEETAARLAAEERVEAERQQARAAEERRRVEYMRQQEILRQQQAQAAAQQKWQQEEQRRAQAAAAEQQRRYQQQQQYYAQQQAAAAEQQRRYQQQQQWNQQHPGQQRPPPNGQYPQQQHFPGYQTPPPGHQTPPPGQYPQPGPGPQARPGGPPPGAAGGPPPGANAGSQANQKWAHAAEETTDSGQSTTVAIKHHILIHWALQPPTMQMLRPIDGLLTSIHSVFPPTTGVPAHDYFKKWKPLSMESISEEGRPDENKLAKSVKKLRFFLHPDKLPRDLNDEQSFLCKMLWDITSDAWEDYQKNKEDLDWLNKS